MIGYFAGYIAVAMIVGAAGVPLAWLGARVLGDSARSSVAERGAAVFLLLVGAGLVLVAVLGLLLLAFRMVVPPIPMY